MELSVDLLSLVKEIPTPTMLGLICIGVVLWRVERRVFLIEQRLGLILTALSVRLTPTALHNLQPQEGQD